MTFWFHPIEEILKLQIVVRWQSKGEQREGGNQKEWSEFEHKDHKIQYYQWPKTEHNWDNKRLPTTDNTNDEERDRQLTGRSESTGTRCTGEEEEGGLGEVHLVGFGFVCLLRRLDFSFVV